MLCYVTEYLRVPRCDPNFGSPPHVRRHPQEEKLFGHESVAITDARRGGSCLTCFFFSASLCLHQSLAGHVGAVVGPQPLSHGVWKSGVADYFRYAVRGQILGSEGRKIPNFADAGLEMNSEQRMG